MSARLFLFALANLARLRRGSQLQQKDNAHKEKVGGFGDTSQGTAVLVG